MVSKFSFPNYRYQTTTHSAEETKRLGSKIGDCLKAEAIFALTGDLGSGKTTFVQGLAKGLDVPDGYYITSPSYTLINEYPGRFPLFHVDLYRIEDPVDFEDIGLYEILDDNNVVAIEWSDRIQPELLPEHVTIQFEISGEDSRNIYLSAYGLKGVNLLRKIET